jgi:3-methyladenine DNA glycosylase/8-oxoguanine DNA glycosylase
MPCSPIQFHEDSTLTEALLTKETAVRPDGLRFDPDEAVRHLSAADPALGLIIERSPPFSLRPTRTQSLFAALLESIVYQQLSGRAAETILNRVLALYRPRRFPRPSDLLETPEARLRAAGLSRNKTAALHDLARRALEGTVPSLARAHAMTDEELVDRLTAVRGVGRWTVEMILIFRLGRPDVLPVSDLGVRKGFRRAFGMRGLPAAVTMTRRGERWRPYRSVASWYLWRAAELD